MDEGSLKDYYNFINSEINKKGMYVNQWHNENIRELVKVLNYMRKMGMKCDKGEKDERGFYNVKIWKELPL